MRSPGVMPLFKILAPTMTNVEGIPLICIHMGWACSLQWQYFMPIMAEAGFHVIAPDLPGHAKAGFSQYRNLPAPTVPSMRKAVAENDWNAFALLDVVHVDAVNRSIVVLQRCTGGVHKRIVILDGLIGLAKSMLCSLKLACCQIISCLALGYITASILITADCETCVYEPVCL